MNREQHYARMKALSAEGERRGREAGVTGPVNLNTYLNEDEQRQLAESLKAQTWKPSIPLPPGVSVDRVAG
jgi:hypothetical protein